MSVFESMKKGDEEYPGFFTWHSMGFAGEGRTDGKYLMEKAWSHMKAGLYSALMNDRKICKDAFDENFTEEDFAEIIFSLILASFVQHDFDARRIFNMIRKMLY